jgi:hypothetical protein
MTNPILNHPFLQGWTWLARNERERTGFSRWPAVRSLYRQHYRGRPLALIRFWYFANDRPKMGKFK